eukprot:549520-Pyramimonas_sp.AAC.1
MQHHAIALQCDCNAMQYGRRRGDDGPPQAAQRGIQAQETRGDEAAMGHLKQARAAPQPSNLQDK